MSPDHNDRRRCRCAPLGAIPESVQVLAHRNAIVHAHLAAFGHGQHATELDALAAIVVSLAELNDRYFAAELRRAIAAPGRLFLTAEERAALGIPSQPPATPPSQPARGWGESR